MKKNRKLLKQIFFISLIFFLMSELLSKYVLGLGNIPLSMAHPTIEYMFQPKQKVARFGNQIIINQYGMRSDNFSKEKPNNEYRIIVIGDSIVFGGNLTNQNSLATTIVQNKLQSLGNKEIVVGNISAGSWGPGNWLAYIKEYGFFNADEIILVISSHDYTDNPEFTPLSPVTHPQQQPLLAVEDGYTRYLLPKLGRIIGNINPSAEIEKEKTTNPLNIKQSLSDLKELLQLAKKTGAKVHIIQHWSRTEIENGKAEDGNQEIKAITQQLNLSTTQNKLRLSRAYQAGQEPFRDSIHPNDLGQKLLAEEMLDVLNYPE